MGKTLMRHATVLLISSLLFVPKSHNDWSLAILDFSRADRERGNTARRQSETSLLCDRFRDRDIAVLKHQLVAGEVNLNLAAFAELAEQHVIRQHPRDLSFD